LLGLGYLPFLVDGDARFRVNAAALDGRSETGRVLKVWLRGRNDPWLHVGASCSPSVMAVWAHTEDWYQRLVHLSHDAGARPPIAEFIQACEATFLFAFPPGRVGIGGRPHQHLAVDLHGINEVAWVADRDCPIASIPLLPAASSVPVMPQSVASCPRGRRAANGRIFETACSHGTVRHRTICVGGQRVELITDAWPSAPAPAGASPPLLLHRVRGRGEGAVNVRRERRSP